MVGIDAEVDDNLTTVLDMLMIISWAIKDRLTSFEY